MTWQLIVMVCGIHVGGQTCVEATWPVATMQECSALAAEQLPDMRSTLADVVRLVTPNYYKTTTTVECKRD